MKTTILKTDSFAITGGEFGIEASVIAVAGYVIVGLIAFSQIHCRLNHRELFDRIG